MVGEAGSRLLGFFAIVYLARQLGPSGMGQVGFSMALLTYFLMVVRGGINTYGMREISRGNTSHKSIIYEIVSLKIILAVLLYGILFIIVQKLPNIQHMSLLILVFGLSLFANTLDIEWYFKGIEKTSIVAIGSLFRWLFFLIVTISFVARSEHLIYVALSFSGGYFLASLITFVYALYLEKGRGGRLQISKWGLIVRESWPMLLSTILVVIHTGFDKIAIQVFHGERYVGLYETSYRVSQLLRIMSTSIMFVFFPTLARCFNDKSDLQDISTKYIKTMFILAVPIVIGGIVLSSKILRLVFGVQYMVASLTLQIHFVSTLIAFGNGSYASPLNAWDRQKVLAACIGVGAVFNVLFNLYLVPIYGIEGAAAATMIAEFVVFVLSYIAFNKVVRVPLYQVISKPLFASLAMGLAIYLFSAINIPVLVLIPLGGLLYTGLLFLIRAVTWQELRIIFGIKPADKEI